MENGDHKLKSDEFMREYLYLETMFDVSKDLQEITSGKVYYIPYLCDSFVL